MTNWNVPVSSRLDDQVEKAVKEGFAVSKSELIRFAVVSYLRYLRETEKSDVHFQSSKGQEPTK